MTATTPQQSETTSPTPQAQQPSSGETQPAESMPAETSAAKTVPVETGAAKAVPVETGAAKTVPAETGAVDAVVARARQASIWWSGLSFRDRKDWIAEYRKYIATHADELIEVIVTETGKPRDDAFIEVMSALEHMKWAADNAERVLARRKVKSGFASANQAASVGYEPFGVVGVIGPWNYPIYTPGGSISYALAAGNAIVFKPSEYTPGTGLWLAKAWEALAAPQPVIQAVAGDGAVGAALTRADIDKIAFTGSTATAKKVMATAAENLLPIVAECGGKDAMIVAADANLEAAAEAAAFGAFGNSGQTCAGVERVYVEEAVYDKFLALLIAKGEKLRPGTDPDSSSYGRMTMPSQIGIVKSHIDDALARGGKAVLGGPASVGESVIGPVILVDVPEDSRAITEETFGPTVVVNRVADLSEAIARANATRYGLGTLLFSTSKATAARVIAEAKSGVVTVNSVLGFAAIGSLPFGGRGDSGFGRIHGDDGLREFATVKSVTEQRWKPPMNLTTFDRKARDLKVLRTMFGFMHGKGK